jgi:hypothetical protein
MSRASDKFSVKWVKLACRSHASCDILTVTYSLWHSHCDRYSLWHSHCDILTVTFSLWQILTVTFSLWYTHCDRYSLWHSHCDILTVTFSLWLTHCDILTVTFSLWYTVKFTVIFSLWHTHWHIILKSSFQQVECGKPSYKRCRLMGDRRRGCGALQNWLGTENGGGDERLETHPPKKLSGHATFRKITRLEITRTAASAALFLGMITLLVWV